MDDCKQAAARFPSSNRSSIITEIKEEFRESRAITDSKECQLHPFASDVRLVFIQIARRRALAVDGLRKLEAYSNLDKSSTQWDVYMAGMEHKFD
eukprot:2352207-Pyramimonas_sp.AAC.3